MPGSKTGRSSCGDEAWEAVRIEAGVPVAGREMVEGTIAAEVGLVERTVSFTKGCFTGQELVARLDARGTKVARRLCGVDDRRRDVRGRPAPPAGASVGSPETRTTRWGPLLGGLVAGARIGGGPGHAAPPGGPPAAVR